MAVSENLPKIDRIVVYSGYTPTGATVYWDIPDVSGTPGLVISGYKVERKRLESSVWVHVADVFINSHSEENLEYGVTYQWRVTVLYPEGSAVLVGG